MARKEEYNKEGVCYNCGSDDIEYMGSDSDWGVTVNQYLCNECGADGQEVWEVVFLANERSGGEE